MNAGGIQLQFDLFAAFTGYFEPLSPPGNLQKAAISVSLTRGHYYFIATQHSFYLDSVQFRNVIFTMST